MPHKKKGGNHSFSVLQRTLWKVCHPKSPWHQRVRLQERDSSVAEAAKKGWGAEWPAGGEKLVLSQKYLGDQRTEKFSHAWTRKSRLNLLDKTP